MLAGINRWIHDHAGPATMVFVTGATIFSIVTQVYVLGHSLTDIADYFRISTGQLLLAVLPHAITELTAVFLPLAAFLLASRRKLWGDLLAATFATVAVALPVVISSAFLEAYLFPVSLESLIP